MNYFVIFTLLAFLIVVCYLDIFKFIISRDYWDGLRVVPIVMMAEIFMGIYFNLSFWYKLNGETWWGVIFSTAGCFVLIMINLLFVPKFGYMACAWGGFAGYGVCMVLSYWVGRKNNPVPYQLKVIVGYFILAGVLYFLSWLISRMMVLGYLPANIWLKLGLNTVLVSVYLAVLLYSERLMVRRAVTAVKQKILHKK